MKKLLIGLTFFPFSLFASPGRDCETGIGVEKQADEILKIAKEANNCPSKAKLTGLCNTVSLRTKDTAKDSSFVYTYQKKVFEAACADPDKDSEEEVSKKIREMWTAYQDDLVCDSSAFDVSRGSILKYAVAMKFNDFLEDAAMVWKINLNKVDANDGRTVLDYVQKEIERNKGNVNESTLKQYYDILRKAGAKHKSEL